MRKTAFEYVCDLLNHPRAEVTWLCRPGVDDNGNPRIIRMARIIRVPPRDGAGRLRVGVTDWGESGNGEPAHYYGSASGYGYDKTAAALDGCTLGGVKVGNHSNRDGAPVWNQVANRVKRNEGWEFIGNF